ncbi:MAG: hypothetical protein KDA84_26935, partial [Planctomycetaceae bacterium]|nr:hypothetical protein [Planctomycetaceae bacterium]
VPEILPAALQLYHDCETQKRRHVAALLSRVLVLAWEHANDDKVANHIAAEIVRRLLDQKEDFGSLEIPNQISTAIRHSLLDRVIALLDDADAVGHYALVNSPLVTPGDIDFLLNRTLTADEHTAERWGRLLKLLARWYREIDLSVVASHIESNSVIAKEFGRLITPIEIDSPEAHELREAYHHQQRRIKEMEAQYPSNEVEPLDPPAAEQVNKWLDHCETESPGCFTELVEILKLDCSMQDLSTRWADSDIAGMPGWERADAPTRQRIIGVARRYLSTHKTQPEEYLNRPVYSDDDFPGLPALRLLWHFDSAFLDTLSKTQWRNWIPVVFAFPAAHGMGDEAERERQALIAMAYQRDPETVVDVLLRMIDRDSSESDHLFVLSDVECC